MPDTDLDLDNAFLRTRQKSRFGARHVQIIFTFFCLTISVAMRINLSVAIVAMTDNTTSSNPNIPTYNWHNTSVILTAFFWGYIVLQIMGGYMAKIYGPKMFLLGSVFSNSVAFVCIPLSAKYAGATGVMVLRIIQGIGQGCLFPCAHTVLGKWAPAEERGVMGVIIYSGLSCGCILSLIITGYLCSTSLGWPSSFYLFGACGLIWCLLYFKFGHNSPASHPTISPAERRLIETSLHSGSAREPAIPWKSILTCIHFWAIVSANMSNGWGYTMLMTQVPTYLAKVMKFDIKSNGMVSATPYIVSAILGLIFGRIADYIVLYGYLSALNCRRTFQLSGAYLLVTCLLCLAYLTETQAMAVTLLSIGNAAYAATLVGYAINHVDLSPRFAGIMQGISNCLSQTVAMFSPLIVQFIVTELDNPKQWRIVFIIAAIFYFIGSTLFAIFASATRQEWDGTDSVESLPAVSSRHQSMITIYKMSVVKL